MSGEPVDFITVLASMGPLAAKQITAVPGAPPQIEPYGAAKYFSFSAVVVSSFNDLATMLSHADRTPRSFIVRGRLKDPKDYYRRAQRLSRDRRNSDGTIVPATLEAEAHHWIPLDCDRIACPDWLDPLYEPDWAVEHVVSQLPAEFHDATVRWQFTASAGIKPGISLRLFFWADRPLADWELKQWLADAPVDHSIFAPAQPIYTAWPIFVGMPDPVPFRSGIWRGDRDSITPPEIEKPKGRVFTGHAFTGSTGGAGYEFRCSRIGDHDFGGGFFAPVKSAVAAWIARQGAAVDTAWLRDDLERVIRAAPRDPAKHDDQYVDVRVADLDPLIDAILEMEACKEVQAEALPPRFEPTYPAPMTSVAEARAALNAAMDRFAAVALAYGGAEPWAMAA